MRHDEPSSTALFVAQGVWWVGRHAELSPEVPFDMERWNRHLVQRATRGLTMPPGRWLHSLRLSLLQWLSVAGFYLHFVLRKRRIEHYARRCLEAGARQLVVIGAGYDTLSLRVAEQFPGVRVFEVDHPATQARKSQLLGESQDRTLRAERSETDSTGASRRLHFVPLDLTQSNLEQALRSTSAYDANAQTVFVAEGLLMYLTEPQVRRLFDSVRGASGPGSYLVFTYMQPSSSGKVEFQGSSWWVNQWLRWKGERFTWGVSSQELGGFVEGSKLRLVEQVSGDQLRALLSEGNRRSPVAVGENVALTEVIS